MRVFLLQRKQRKSKSHYVIQHLSSNALNTVREIQSLRTNEWLRNLTMKIHVNKVKIIHKGVSEKGGHILDTCFVDLNETAASVF
jgi:hypothetical protein